MGKLREVYGIYLHEYKAIVFRLICEGLVKNRKAQNELGFVYLIENGLVSTVFAPKKHIHQLSKHEDFKYIP